MFDQQFKGGFMFRKVRNFQALLFLISISMLLSLPGYSQNHYSQKFASLTDRSRQDNASVVSVDLRNVNTVKQNTPILKGKDHGIAIEPAWEVLDNLTAAQPGGPIISVKGDSLPIYLFDMLTTSLKSAFTNFSFISTAHANIVCCTCSDRCFDGFSTEDCLMEGCFPSAGVCVGDIGGECVNGDDEGCCFLEVNGEAAVSTQGVEAEKCIETTETFCGDVGGIYQGNGTDCALDFPEECDFPPLPTNVPTIGQWGMIAMAVLLGLFALFIIIRRLRHKVG
jgi:hypothetical protein